ncbi:hypothetical protein [Sporosarcina highlanderae]|uniref:Rad50/SbcC-type AAA domain-containing protein n=1 Tax=Sporosarcina highlanderae TaxID=3035916 RepID=A0ABT8JSN8_9BACL|nr:hypothetical protein [Sporosarcina highlanderae]MDN4608155.1 hypothetical protein [Sporosarcina highlanderae]
MIPWRLRFSGIRDYGAEEMMLGGTGEHILITGPNGAGKSTISFCMGAVLRSGKVVIDGLKSQNLREEDTWRAAIHLLFKNVGSAKIDAPLFIEFRLLVEQQPQQPVKLRYEIHDGDELEDLELRQTYRSGDVNKNNFTAYRRELEYKYKIHPDLYYLIWYQQEVNQFSVMTPEERFRIFSEMHGIDTIQKDWETSLEVAKEAREAFNQATNQQKQQEFNLSIVRGQKERFENNRKRLEENGYLYALTTQGLQKLAEQDGRDAELYIDERQAELDELSDKEQQIVGEIEQEKESISQIIGKQEDMKGQLVIAGADLKSNEQQHQTVGQVVDKLNNELSDLQEAYNALPYPEAETKERLKKTEEHVQVLEANDEEVNENLVSTDNLFKSTIEKQSELKAAIAQWEEIRIKSQVLIDRYKSSHQLEEKLQALEETLTQNKDLRDSKLVQQKAFKEELSMLNNNQIESTRQQQAIRHLKQQNIRAYPFRHFIKMKEQVPIDKEKFLDTIKYTIFYEAASCEPVNDLYHVSLKKILPDRSLTELTALGLEMREGLSVMEQNHAARVLWWVEQFLINDQPKLQNGFLVDKQGVRGPQEENTFILSTKALQERQNFLQRQLAALGVELKELTSVLSSDNMKFQVWNADVQKVKEAEAFLSTIVEQEYRIAQLKELDIEKHRLEEEKKRLEEENKEIFQQKHIKEQTVNYLRQQLEIYKQFGQQSKKIESLQRLKHEMLQLKTMISTIRRTIDKLQDELDSLQQLLRTQKRNLIDLEERLTAVQRERMQVTNQKVAKEEERIAFFQDQANYKEELAELRLVIPEIVEQACAEELMKESKFNLQNKQSHSKIGFQHALNEPGIDPNAVENFRTLEQEVIRKKEELQSAKNLLEENEERAIQNEQRLETAIHMQVSKIDLLFQQYMGEFKFEGQIKYEKSLDKERPVFKLFIHVRKEGHRGKFEDVNKKARGNRVGKGVSGGEESMSSLLFALSLLQNLENRAGFIVLDEFDSALDDKRKVTVFELYASKLQRKLIILSPKAHENEYYDQFSKAFIVSHDPKEMRSKIRGIQIG